MRIITRCIAQALLACSCILLSPAAHGQPAWADEQRHLSMTGPATWSVMDDALLLTANTSVSHVTGRGFIAGFSAHDADVLLFPYILIQYKPYTDLPAAQQPTSKLDDRGKLELLLRITRAFDVEGGLPDDIDIPAFIERYPGERGRLLAMDDDGRFDFTGRIPLQGDAGSIDYHTHGVLGLEGAAMVTIFENERFDTLGPIIEGALRTLAFEDGYGYSALPDEPSDAAGFRPPPVQAIPPDYLRVGGRSFAFPKPKEPGYYVLNRASAATMPPAADALPRGLENGAVEVVLTRTPTASTITHPWIAAGFTPWADSLLAVDRLPHRLTDEQWAGLLAGIVDASTDDARREIARLREDPAAEAALRSREAGSALRLESVDLDAGRLLIREQFPADDTGTPARTRYTAIVLGAGGAAVLITQDYSDGAAPIKQTLADMADAGRYEGGARYADVPLPPSDEAAQADASSETTPAPTTDTPAPEADADPTAATLQQDSAALPIILGGLGLVALIVMAIVATLTHLNMKKKRERAQARRERLAHSAVQTKAKR